MILPLLLALAPSVAPVQDCGSSCGSKAKAAVAANVDAPKDIVDTAVAAGSFKTLVAAVQAADLVDALKGKGPFTVFAPTDEAFAALPKGTLETLLDPKNKGLLTSILTYHVVSGDVRAKQVVKLDAAGTLNGQRVEVVVKKEGVFIDGAQVVTTDIECANGVIHVIDKVILPSSNDIISTAVEAGAFKTLAAAIKAAGLVEALKGDGPFTVFAPTDDAFAALPEGTVASLLKPENKEKLAAVLTYHVVPGRVFSDAAAKGAKVKTLQGGELTTRGTDDGVFVNGAKVVKADLDCTIGVIHVIDKVLLPQ